MKKLILLLVLIFAFGCASVPKKSESCNIPSYPSHEEILAKTQLDGETLLLMNWWQEFGEKELVAWFSTITGAQVNFEFKEAVFIGDFEIGMVHLKASSINETADFYLLVDRDDNVKWGKIIKILVKNSKLVEQEGKEK